ncbi:6-bladed beta-propeller [Mucilaginibacter sp. BJC16-A38]|uniref:6-bladed beta-propeller n=1 Tax=Mucilaginibacter phenanthrenivorans TaxID=1234842 RepID=UPI00215735E6|nr:6-bladed beta-propeller [Mucilaginibacter phenanthrenivorans]MCR8561071.1 6-bladed beta-propeller [Mucilaginibacter phenanthrenivorans]
MSQKQFIYILFVPFLLLGCKKHVSVNYRPQYILDFSNTLNDTSTRLINKLKVISLKNNHDSVIISEVSKIIVEGNRLYILDRKLSQLALFDTLGNFKQIIGQVGTGPGEYQNIKDFVLKENAIVVYTDIGKKLIFFDKASTKYISQQRVPLFATLLFNKPGGFLFYINNNPATYESEAFNNAIWTNDKLEPIAYQFPFEKVKEITGMTGGISDADNASYLYNPAFSDSIYSFDEKRIKLKYQVKFGNAVPSKFQNIDAFYALPFEKGLSYSFLTPDFKETDHILLFNYQKNKHVDNFGIYFLKTQHFITQRVVGSYSNYLFKIFDRVVGTNGDNFIFFINPEKVNYLRTHNKRLFDEIKKESSGEIDHVLSSLDVNSNPVIVLCKFNQL